MGKRNAPDTPLNEEMRNSAIHIQHHANQQREIARQTCLKVAGELAKSENFQPSWKEDRIYTENDIIQLAKYLSEWVLSTSR